MRYIKYYISTFTLILAIKVCFLGEYYPTIFFIGFSLFIILGDILLKKDIKENSYSYTYFLNFPMYINLPLLMIIVLISIFVLGDHKTNLFSDAMLYYLNLDLLYSRESLNLLDSISLIILISLFIGIMGTVPGHELIHRKKNKFDMLIGNWLLAFSWDCAFALEHVYGHHKNVGLENDPATAKRGENIYGFIMRAIFKEHIDAWIIESKQSKKKDRWFFRLDNTMIIGYLRSICITCLSFWIGGFYGMIFYLLLAFISKSLLEVINYSEHYGLVRVEGKSVRPRHSWNSNSVMSSIYLYNVTRHSSHHEKASLKYWELKSYQDAPMMPYGYLTMLYIAIFLPYIYHNVMAKKLIEWDNHFATKEERLLAKTQNKNSGIPLLKDNL